MKTIKVATVIAILLSPFFISAKGEFVEITSLREGFVITGEEKTIPVGGTINKGYWDNQIVRKGGEVIALASTENGTVSQAINQAFPMLDSANKYGLGGIVFDVDTLRGETEVPITARIEVRNSQGVIVAYEEIHGTLQPVSEY